MSGSNTWLMNAIEWGVYPNTGGGGGSFVKLSPTTDQIIAGAYSLGANNLLPGFLIVPSASGTTVLTKGSPQVISITGNQVQTFTMPDVTTLANVSTNTTPYTFINSSSLAVTVNSSGGNLIATVSSNSVLTLYLTANTGTDATPWFVDYVNISGAVLLNPGASQTITGNYTLGVYTLHASSAIQATTFQPSGGVNGLTLTNVSLAVNYIDITNAASLSYPIIQPKGNAANLGIDFNLKGTGIASFTTANTNSQINFKIASATSALSFPTGVSHTNIYTFPDLSGGGTSNLVVDYQVQQNKFNYAAASGSNNAFVATLTPAVSALTDGLTVYLQTGTLTNTTTAPTLQVNALSPATIKLTNGGALASGDMPTNTVCILVYNANATAFELLNPSVSASSSGAVLLSPGADQTITGNYNLISYGLTATQSALIGSTSGAVALNTLATLEVVGGISGVGDTTINATGFSNIEPGFVNIVSNSATPGSFSPVAAGVALGYWQAQGDDGTSYSSVAGYAEWTVDIGATVSTNIVPGRFTLYTTNSSGTPTATCYADSEQNFTVPQGVFVLGQSTGAPTSLFKMFSPTSGLGNLVIIATDNGGDYSNLLTNISTTSDQSWVLPDESGTIALAGSPNAGFVQLNPGGNQTILGTSSLIMDQGSYYATVGNFYAPQGFYFSGDGAAGGSAGTYIAYSPTANSGVLAFVASDCAGNYSGELTNAHLTTDREWFLPDFTGTLIAQGQDIYTPSILDSNLLPILGFTTIASPVNYIEASNAASGDAPSIGAQGTDANIRFEIYAKGPNGGIAIRTECTAIGGSFNIYSGTSGQHQSNFNFANTPGTRMYTFQDVSGTLCQDNSNSGSITTAPPASAAASLSLGSAYQNAAGYDVVITVYLSVTAATTASILSGVGSTNTPTQQTIVSSLTVAAVTIIPVTLYIPAGYYALLSTSGTITATISGQQTMAV